MNWAQFDAGKSASGDAYARYAAALPNEYWFQTDLLIPASTLTVCADHDNFGRGGFNMVVLTNTLNIGDGVYSLDQNSPNGAWRWAIDDFGTVSAVPLLADTAYTLKVHVVGTVVSWYINGVLRAGPYNVGSFNSPHGGILIGSYFWANGCPCERYYVSNVKVGTTDGGSDIFADDFSSGDFTHWTSTVGNCAVVASPLQCVPAVLAASPTHGCAGQVVHLTGSGFSPSSPVTVTTVSGNLSTTSPFSTATTDATGSISGSFVFPYGWGNFAPGGTVDIHLTDGDGNFASVRFTICCNVTYDESHSATTGTFGPSIPSTEDVWGYCHAGGAHWILDRDVSVQGSPSSLPPAPNHAFNLHRIPDDGSPATSYPIDTDYAWRFNSSESDFLFCGNTRNDLFFNGWDKPVYDAQLVTDGTKVWVVILTAETVVYPFITSDDGHCGQLSQAAQFVDLATLTSGFTVFPTSPGAGGVPYQRVFHNSSGPLNLYDPNFPNSDGGDHWFGYWNPPRVVVFAGDAGGFTRIGEIDSLYYGGNTDGVGQDGAIIGGPSPPRYQEGPRGRFLSALAVCASEAEPGVCHVLWSEGGAWGRCGAGPVGGTVATVWDANQPNQDYRINYSRWSTAAETYNADIWHTHIDRTNWWFPFESDPGQSGSTTVYRNGYSWPPSMEGVATAILGLKNEHGAPAMFLDWLLVRPTPSPRATDGANPDAAGNYWLDVWPDFAEATMRYYDLSSGAPVLKQTLDASLLPTQAELSVFYKPPSYNPPPDGPENRYGFGNFGNEVWDTPASWPGPAAFRGFSLSHLYLDPTAGDEPVYLIKIPWATAEYNAAQHFVRGTFPAQGFYRIPADGSGTFEMLDGIRVAQYSIFLPINFQNVPGDAADFFSDDNNIWYPSGSVFRVQQLERRCLQTWFTPNLQDGANVSPEPISHHGYGCYYDPVADRLYFASFGSGLSTIAVGKLTFCRGCGSCACAQRGGLLVSKRIHYGKTS